MEPETELEPQDTEPQEPQEPTEMDEWFSYDPDC